MLHDLDFTHPLTRSRASSTRKMDKGTVTVPPFEEARG
jgi:hypothetical protein